MNKKTLLSIVTASFLLVGIGIASFNVSDNAYTPRVKQAEGPSGYSQYLNSMRADKSTGEVDPALVAQARQDAAELSNAKTKVEWPVNWRFRGPDNIGGRTRCLVIDKDNPSILYSGGVSGAVFKSINKGGSWFPLTENDDNFGVIGMAQTSDGHLYYGTGEAGLLLTNIIGSEQSGFQGMGMFKSTDGETFQPVQGTENFGNIHVLTAHPTRNEIYCGSSNGLRMSNDAGATWTTLLPIGCRDIKFNKNGVALAYTATTIRRSVTPEVAGTESYQIITGLANNSRSVIAWSESDPTYVYIVQVGQIAFPNTSTGGGALAGIYRSKDEGATFERIVGPISRFFAPFTIVGTQSQGNYDLAAGVHPRDKDRLFIGGIYFAEWTEEAGPKLVGNLFDSPSNPFGIHADKHYITFDNTGTDPIMYICNDGGISRTTNEELNNYRDISNGLTTTQYFAIDADINGRIMGGTQDNSTILLAGESFPRQIGQTVLGGDGFETAFSDFNPDIVFGESQFGNLRRSVTGGPDMQDIWDNRVEASFASTARNTNYFSNPLWLWEDPVLVDSTKDFGNVEGRDTVIDARLYFAMDDGIWMCKNALSPPHNPDVPKDEDQVRWFRVSTITNVHNLISTKDGSSLFITTNNGRIHRIDSLLVTQFDTTSLPGFNQIASKLNTVNITNNLAAGGRTVTSIALDDKDPNRVIATVGNYGGTNFVYESKNVLSENPTWTSIQGNLPRFPVYHALISVDDPDIVMVGTEFGVYATNTGVSSSTNWAPAMQGEDPEVMFPTVPVFDLVQVENKTWSGPRVYAGTHGMGVWETRSLLSGVEDEVKIEKESPKMIAYPNPANNYVNLKGDLVGAYTLSVYAMNGQVVASDKGNMNGTIQVNTSELPNGNYFVEILNGGQKSVTKIIVQH